MQMKQEALMKRSIVRGLAPLAAVLLLLTATACGGGGGNVPGGGGGGGLAAVFTAGNPSPGANSITMAPGAANNATFEVIINMTDVMDFFGTGFRVTFDPAEAQFQSFDDSGSWLQTLTLGMGVTVNVNAVVDPNDAGTVFVNATLQGQSAGFDLTGTQELLSLTFVALTATAGNNFSFDVAGTRVVTTCADAINPCTDLADGSLTWSGGTLTAN